MLPNNPYKILPDDELQKYADLIEKQTGITASGISQVPYPSGVPVREKALGRPSLNTSIRKIANGFVVVHGPEEYFCEGMKEAGEQITALLVKQYIEKG